MTPRCQLCRCRFLRAWELWNRRRRGRAPGQSWTGLM